ncbi:MAG TPA: N-acetylmuramoyl-L-alanine amidase, partial [Bacteroidales bacterium]|nr:N-acetylmuramoyl-L-alanine amidase [Bacteroidales bacterium]
AGFLVLYKTAMPGVLIETGFISNPSNERFLLSEKGQDLTAQAIFRALRDYKYQLEKRTPPAQDSIIVSKNTDIAGKEMKPEQKTPKENPPVKTDSVPVKKNPGGVVSYRVQFAMFPEQKPLSSPLFKGLENVKMYEQGGAFKYTAGDYATLDEAMQYRKEIISKGYKDAFVVAFKGKQRITNEEARRLTEKK